MNRLRATDKPHRCDAVAVVFDALNGCFADDRMIRHAEVIVRRHHDDGFPFDDYDTRLRRFERRFIFKGVGVANTRQFGSHKFDVVHGFRLGCLHSEKII